MTTKSVLLLPLLLLLITTIQIYCRIFFLKKNMKRKKKML